MSIRLLLCLKTVETEGRNKKPPARRVEKKLKQRYCQSYNVECSSLQNSRKEVVPYGRKFSTY